MFLDEAPRCLAQTRHVPKIHVLTLGHSHDHLHELEATQRVIVVLIHIDFLEVCGLEVGVNDARVDVSVWDLRILHEEVEFSPVDIGRISVVARCANENVLEWLKVLSDHLFDVHLLGVVVGDLFYLPVLHVMNVRFG